MKSNEIVKFCSPSKFGYRYNVYSKHDTKENHILFMGVLSKDGKNDHCTCEVFLFVKNCEHLVFARGVMVW